MANLLRRSWVLTAIGMAPCLAALLVPRSITTTWDPMIRVAIIAPLLIWATVFMMLAWLRHDEVSKEAHKWAFLWGGSIGAMLALTAGGAVLLWPPLGHMVEGVIASLPKAAPTQTAFVVGELFVAMSLALGYFLALAGWWVARR